MNKNRLLIYTLFTLAFIVSAYASIAYTKPVGADIWFHLKITETYLQGQNGMFAPFVMQTNHIPYPPLFHMLLLPSAALGVSLQFARFLQALIYPTCLLFTLLLVEKFGFGKLHILVTGLALIGSAAYLDATFQIRPESLDILLWLTFAYAALNGKGKLTVASVVAGVYNHSFPALAFMGGPLLYQRRWKQILAIIAFSVPILAVSLFYILDFAGTWYMTPASPQARGFITNPILFTFNYTGALLIGIPIAAISLVKWRSLTLLSKLSLLTVISSLALLPLWYDRYFQYVSVPLAIVTGEFAAGQKSPLRWYVLLFVAVFFGLMYLNLWMSNLYRLWDIH